MTLYQLVTVCVLVWLSGALFGAGWRVLHDGPARHRSGGLPTGPRKPERFADVLIWGLVGAGVVWALVVILKEVSGLEILRATGQAYWAD